VVLILLSLAMFLGHQGSDFCTRRRK